MGSLVLLIAVILIFKALFSNFGFRSSDEEKSEEEKAIGEFLKQNIDKIKNGKDVKNVFVVDLSKNDTKVDSNTIKTVENVLNQEAMAYSKDMFLKRVENVVEAVVTGFANGNEGILKELLTDKLFTVFSNEIDKNLMNNQFLKSVIVSFDNKKLLNDFDQNSRTLSIALDMKQINYIEDQEHNVIHGDKNRSVVIREIWTFVKNEDPKIQSPWLVDSITEYKE